MMRQWSKKITVAGTQYQNDDLVGAEKIKFVYINKQPFVINIDFTFDITTGTFDFLEITLSVGDSIVFMYKK